MTSLDCFVEVWRDDFWEMSLMDRMMLSSFIHIQAS